MASGRTPGWSPSRMTAARAAGSIAAGPAVPDGQDFPDDGPGHLLRSLRPEVEPRGPVDDLEVARAGFETLTPKLRQQAVQPGCRPQHPDVGSRRTEEGPEVVLVPQ